MSDYDAQDTGDDRRTAERRRYSRRNLDRNASTSGSGMLALFVLLLMCAQGISNYATYTLLSNGPGGKPFSVLPPGSWKMVVGVLSVTNLSVLWLAAIWFRRFIRGRSKSELVLRESEDFARATVDALPTHIAILDENGVVLSTNRAWREFADAGAKAEENAETEPDGTRAKPRGARLIRNATNYLADCDALAGRFCGEATTFAAGIRQVAHFQRDEFMMEYESPGPGGQRRWFLGRVVRFPTPEGARNASTQLVVAHEDITARKLAEEEVHKAKETAELANLTKSSFLANTSHEIRTPMTAILGYAEMLMEDSPTPTERMQCLQTIRRNGEHLLQIINDILDISKIEAQKVTVERIGCELPQLVADVVGLTRAWVSKKGLEFDIVFDKLIPKTITTDPLRAKQVLVNIVSNAIKFTEKGTVRLSVRRDITYFGHTIRFEVTDSGIGMTRDQLGKLFQPFTQADTSTTRKYGGTGLGLTISKRLAKLLGGDITVTSEPGVGSCFTFTLDGGKRENVQLLENLTIDQLTAAAEEDATDDLKLDGRVLLAEDGEDNQDLLSTHLRRAGADVVIAGNGRLAVESALSAEGQGSRFDVILMDMQMPELDGYEATKKLRAAGVQSPIIALTANAMAEDRVRCLEAGCTDYLSKPISRAHLINTVARYLEMARERVPQASSPFGLSGSSSTASSSRTGNGLRSSLQDEPRVQKLLERFVARLPERVSVLEGLLRRQALSDLSHALHQLKGAGGGYGFSAISDLAGRAERRIREEAPLDAIREEVNALVRLVRTVDGYDRMRENDSSHDAAHQEAA